ncbi:MAG: rhomboid family intramembrane serine protease [Luteibaculaceae bacterium]
MLSNPIKSTNANAAELNDKKHLVRSAWVPLGLLIFIWLVFLFEFSMDTKLNFLGIWPQRFLSLPTFFSYWAIHGDIHHLLNNSLPLLFLGWGLFYFYPKVAFKVLIFITLFPALLIWLSARPGYHIGASVIIYGLASYLFFAGVYAKNIRNAAFSLLIVFLYGGLIWGVLPVEAGISWEGHLYGGIAGLIMVWHYRKYISPPIVIDSATTNSEGFSNDDFYYTIKEDSK